LLRSDIPIFHWNTFDPLIFEVVAKLDQLWVRHWHVVSQQIDRRVSSIVFDQWECHPALQPRSNLFVFLIRMSKTHFLDVAIHGLCEVKPTAMNGNIGELKKQASITLIEIVSKVSHEMLATHWELTTFSNA
jgi:hypothetical protein